MMSHKDFVHLLEYIIDGGFVESGVAPKQDGYYVYIKLLNENKVAISNKKHETPEKAQEHKISLMKTLNEQLSILGYENKRISLN